MNSFFLLLVSTILQVVLGLEVIVDYSFRVPTSLGTASPTEARCCPYVNLPVNNTKGMVPPTFFGIGTQKGGTTTLYYQLVKHPQLHGSSKEMHYLDEAGSETYQHYLQRWWRNKKPLKQKKRLNATRVANPKTLFEFSPSYMFVPFSACKAKVIAPNAKFVVLLRDPVDRAYSGFTHAVNVMSHLYGSGFPWMKFTFWEVMEQGIHEVMDDPRCDFQNGWRTYSYNDCLGCMLRWQNVHMTCDARPFVNIYNWKKDYTCTSIGKEHLLRGLYGPQLAWWFTLFDPSQFMILNSKTYFENPFEVLKNVTEFLNLQIPYDEVMFDNASEKSNVGKYHATTDAIMVAETKAVLRQFYKRPNLELYRFLSETGFPDFEPFEPQLKNVDLVNCSDHETVAKGMCGTTLFVSKDRPAKRGIDTSVVPNTFEVTSIETVAPENFNQAEATEIKEELKEEPSSSTLMSSVLWNGSSTVDDPKDQFSETIPTVEIQQLNESQGQDAFTSVSQESDSTVDGTEDPSTASNISTEDRSIESIPEMTSSDASSFDSGIRMRMKYLPNSNMGPNARFQMSKSDRFFRSLSAIVLVGLLFYIFRSLRRHRINPRISSR